MLASMWFSCTTASTALSSGLTLGTRDHRSQHPILYCQRALTYSDARRFMGEWSHSNEPRPANEEVEEKLAVVKHRMGMIAMDCEQSSKGLPLLEEVIITLDQVRSGC